MRIAKESRGKSEVFLMGIENVGEAIPLPKGEGAAKRRVRGEENGTRILHPSPGRLMRATLSLRERNCLAGTHFHSEHILGESAFPASARVIRGRAEQKDIDEFGVQPNFATRSPAMAELVKEVSIRKADEFFDTEKLLDPGGVRARLTWAGGGTHTEGDTLIFVEGDGVLFAGDILMNRRFLAFGAPRSSVRSWIAVIEKAAPLKPTHIVPSHGDLGDGTLIASNLAYLRALQSRVAELKREGKTLQEAADAVTTEFRTTYAGWTGNAGTAARIAYDEAK
jgi:glyoxylase-like metal-dependent hydrolase (beta-lactamase superfamily II)